MNSRRGLTLIELLVILAIIAILVALILPAVFAAREAARRTQCSNNLKQVALAVHGYLGTWSTFPLGEMPGSLSANVAILPYLEQSALYNQFNFIVLPGAGLGVGGSKPTWMGAAASTAVGTRVAVFTCPSDINAIGDGSPPAFWPSNYAWNSGVWWPRTRAWDGLFGRSVREGEVFPVPPDPPLGAVSVADCRDGLSVTLLAAEVACGPRAAGAGRTSVSDCFTVPGLGEKASVDRAIQACASADWRTAALPWGGNWRHKGFPWVEGTLWRGWFNTLQGPNQNCCVEGSGGYTTAADWWYMIKPASSYHGGMVNAAMADASVRAFPQAIDLPLWRALGTRAGGEVASP